MHILIRPSLFMIWNLEDFGTTVTSTIIEFPDYVFYFIRAAVAGVELLVYHKGWVGPYCILVLECINHRASQLAVKGIELDID